MVAEVVGMARLQLLGPRRARLRGNHVMHPPHQVQLHGDCHRVLHTPAFAFPTSCTERCVRCRPGRSWEERTRAVRRGGECAIRLRGRRLRAGGGPAVMSCECALRAARAGRRLGARRGGSSGTHRASSPCLACPPTTAPKPPARYASTGGTDIPGACLSLAPNAAQRTHALQTVWLHAQLGCRLLSSAAARLSSTVAAHSHARYHRGLARMMHLHAGGPTPQQARRATP